MKNLERHLTLLCDFYELTMAQGYFHTDIKDKYAYFDVFFRRSPDGGGFAIFAGLEQIVNYINSLYFDDSDIEYLRNKAIFDEKFLKYLENFKFNGDIWAVPEGTVIFPGEPVITVRANAIEAQFIETFVLLMFNHASLVATKASRIVRAAEGRPVMEFGSRRAHSADAAIYGARAAYIAGCNSSACTISDKEFGVPVSGTMAHSWIQMFDTEYDAFKAYCTIYPKNPTLLIDTYSVISSGIPNTIRVFKELGIMYGSVRIDSGDITYLTKKCRAMLDAAGLTECKICVSNSLDEYIIRDILRQGACIDSFGVGERLITSKSEPVFGGVYKLCAISSGIDSDSVLIPKIKISENTAKITNPSFKNLYRLYSKKSNKAEADLITLRNEVIDFTKPLEIFDAEHTWKRRIIDNYTARELLVPIFTGGKCIYNCPDIKEIRYYCETELASMWDEVLRFDNPHNYYVDLSQNLWDLKDVMLKTTI